MNKQDIILFCANDSFTKELYKLVDESREHLSKLAWTATATETDIRKHLQQSANLWIIMYKGQPCGCIQLRDEGDAYSIGYWIGKGFAGQGIMKKAVAILIAQVSKPVKAHVWLTNTASRRVLEASGFKSYPSKAVGWVCYKTA